MIITKIITTTPIYYFINVYVISYNEYFKTLIRKVYTWIIYYYYFNIILIPLISIESSFVLNRN